jgi:hypothetical protein
LRHQAALLRVSEHAAERREDLTHHGRGAIAAQAIFEGTGRGHRQLVELHAAEQGDDVKVDVPAILLAG